MDDFALLRRAHRLLLFTVSLLAFTRFAPGSEEDQLTRARAAIAEGNIVAARAAARQVLSTNAGSAEAEAILGLADTAEGDLRSAAQHFEKSVLLQPGTPGGTPIWDRRTCGSSGCPEARRAFLQVLALQPGQWRREV